jgi:hypothetical protein
VPITATVCATDGIATTLQTRRQLPKKTSASV